MSTSWREPNAARWVGVRPGHDGTQVVKSASCGGVATAILYTVTAGKVLLLFNFTLSCDGATGGNAGMFVRDDGDVFQYNLYWIDRINAIPTVCSMAMWMPIEIPAGYDIVLQGGGATHYERGFIHGVEIDA